MISDFIDDRNSGPWEHNMNNNKDQSSNECRSHKSLFIVDWFLCPSPDECIQMEIATHSLHKRYFVQVMLFFKKISWAMLSGCQPLPLDSNILR